LGSDFSELIPISALEKQKILSALDVVARLLPANKEWLSFPEVFVLAMPPSPRKLERGWLDHPLAKEDQSATVYTLKEQKGFYDLGQGHRSPAFKHHLPVFERRADAERSALLLEAQGFENISVLACVLGVWCVVHACLCEELCVCVCVHISVLLVCAVCGEWCVMCGVWCMYVCTI